MVKTMCSPGMKILDAHARNPHSPYTCAVTFISHNSFKFLAKHNNGLMPPFNKFFNVFLQKLLHQPDIKLSKWQLWNKIFRGHNFSTSLGADILKQHKKPLYLVGVTFLTRKGATFFCCFFLTPPECNVTNGHSQSVIPITYY